ncbi:hypothetical protein B188_10080 [Candidatus Brocadiaceae bacterium B188]|nr:hypothetical protein [Candidatus Brocadia sapporoensis]MEB2308223.1 hypothetical protein [Candidatus Brocadiaceae bacterium]QQR66123.1 MAG: hypothetical protein IPI25_11370 [Candidatus Brocadia sp.]RZV56486.1 MAG: hypothetical protein EX330_13270 [Candidatus Brocadia sp. BROELEC01]TWU53044.1 hypothetical protein B188_10080 [Candidatus Brocadiaceae bacterium B188]
MTITHETSVVQQSTTTHHIEHVILGTASHIGHGKTSLAKGADQDRQPEKIAMFHWSLRTVEISFAERSSRTF